MAPTRARQLRKAMPRSEAIMWNALRQLKPLGFHFRRQVPMGPYHVDFACYHPKLVIEVDGATHDDPGEDARRDEYLRHKGYRVLRVGNDDVQRELDGVMRSVQLLLGLTQ